jgi:hypothetical protein
MRSTSWALVKPFLRGFNMAIVIIGEPFRKSKHSYVKHVLAKCECGKEFLTQWYSRRKTKSCGCKRPAPSRLKHGHCMKHSAAESSTYTTWRAMRDRCGNPNNKMFSRYGGRGITVCDRWINFENFLADMQVKPAGSTIERIDSEKGYEPGNCRWATRKEQNRNKSGNLFLTIYGKKLCLAAWCEISGVSQSLAHARLARLGWTEKEAIFGKPKE